MQNFNIATRKLLAPIQEDLTNWISKDFKPELNLQEFQEYLDNEFEHTYDTIPLAITAVALRAARHANNTMQQGGITNEQAAGVMWFFISAWRDFKGPLRLTHFDRMLSPENEAYFEKTISASVFKYLQETAAELLSKTSAVDATTEHWQRIIAGELPFGYKLEASNNTTSV